MVPLFHVESIARLIWVGDLGTGHGAQSETTRRLCSTILKVRLCGQILKIEEEELRNGSPLL